MDGHEFFELRAAFFGRLAHGDEVGGAGDQAERCEGCAELGVEGLRCQLDAEEEDANAHDEAKEGFYKVAVGVAEDVPEVSKEG